MEKTVDRPILRVKKEDSPEQFQLARVLQKKGGRNLILATRECCLGIR